MYPDWLKTTGTFVLVMIVWDILRLFIQAKVTKWMLRDKFQAIQKDLDDLETDVEEAIEEDKNDK